MLVDADGQLRWASASDQTAQTVEDGQERLAQGPCAVAFSQRLPAAIRDLDREPEWAEFTQMLVGEGDRCGLECPGGAGRWGPWDPGWLCRSAVGLGSQRGRGLAGYAGLVASLLSAATTAQVKGRLAAQLEAALEHRWLIEQAKGVLMGREQVDARAAFERLRGRPGPRPGGWPMWPRT